MSPASKPVAHKRAAKTTNKMKSPVAHLTPVPKPSILTSPPTKNPHKIITTNTTTKATVKNKIIFSTTSFGKATPTKIKPITKATKALTCLCSPKTFVFSRIAKTMKKMSRNGRMNLLKITF